MKRLFLSIISFAVLVSCTKEWVPGGLSPEQRSLIGRAVNFSASIAEKYETKASYNLEGKLNDGDFLIVYRQYQNETTKAWGEEDYRVYYRKQEYIPGTNYAVGPPTWKPVVGKQGLNYADDGNHPAGPFRQTDADSLTWDNARTVRYRAIGRSNYAGTIGGPTSSNKNSYYPDYTYCEWVTASGPTNDVAFVMKHLGGRLIFTAKPGNVIHKVEISTDPADYRYADNADKIENDNADMVSEEVAIEHAEAVRNVYYRMCMPAGVDISTGMLKGMTKTYYDGVENFYDIDERTSPDIVSYASKDSTYIRTDVKRPQFNQIDTRFIMITTPYDISSNAGGEPLVLPKHTRFRVYIYDVNSGDDAAHSPNYEKSYHIFSLSDMMTGTGSEAQPVFPDGLELIAGDSYTFDVGYQYDQFTVDVDGSRLSWSQQDEYSGDAADVSVAKPVNETSYAWWTAGMSLSTPAFTISNEAEFMEFISLVNGTAAQADDALKQKYREINRPDGSLDVVNSGYWWYTLDSEGKTVWLEKAGDSTPFASGEIPEAFKDLVFYKHSIQKEGTSIMELRWDYLREAVPFCDPGNGSSYRISLAADLDLQNWELGPVGSASAPFMGIFDGNGHQIGNTRMTGGYVFGNISGAEIRNLRIRSLYPTGLVDTGTDANFISGISIDAPSTMGPSIARSLKGKVEDQQNTSYVVGCIHTGAAVAAMVGVSDSMYMLGCMEAGSGAGSGTSALLGSYGSGSRPFFDPQGLAVTRWDDFMCNYFDTQLSSWTQPAPGKGILDYDPHEYIRGVKTSVLKEGNDYFISDLMPYDKLTSAQKLAFYGLAPYKAMNYAIWMYNQSVIGSAHPCGMKFTVDPVGFNNMYPVLVNGAPGDECRSWNVLIQNN